MSLYLPERKGNDSWNGQEHNKNETGFPIFCQWHLALERATLGSACALGSALNSAFEEAPLGASIVDQEACHKLNHGSATSHLECR